jgi:hypothetical protein
MVRIPAKGYVERRLEALLAGDEQAASADLRYMMAKLAFA